MSTGNTEILDPRYAGLPQHLIDAMQSKEDTGLEGMEQYLSPPRLKVCQPSRKEEFKGFDEGTVLVIPSKEVVCVEGEFFIYTPIYTFDQFCVHNPWKTRETLPMIRESTYDPESEIAQKSRNFIREACPEMPSEEIRYVTHINTFIYIHHVPALENTPVLWSQFMGEWRAGRRMLDLLAARCSNGTPIYGCKLMGTVNLRRDKGNEWYGIDSTNPSADYDGKPWVEDAQLFEQLKELRQTLKANKERFNLNYDDESPESKETEEVTSDTLG